MVMKKKPNQGRQKIAMTKIPKRSNLQVTFSKRRSGLFKKASELCTLCGVEIAMVVFSPANKPFSFGHPNVKFILHRFLTSNPDSNSIAETQYCMNDSVHELNMELTKTQNQLEAEKKRGEALDKMSKATTECWWETQIDELGFDELHILKAALEELKKNVTKLQANKIWMQSSPFSMMNGIQSNDHDHHLFESKHAEIGGSNGSLVPYTSMISASAYGFGYGHVLF